MKVADTVENVGTRGTRLDKVSYGRLGRYFGSVVGTTFCEILQAESLFFSFLKQKKGKVNISFTFEKKKILII